MSGFSDFIFGSGALKKAAGTASKAKSKPSTATIDMAKIAEEEAERKRQIMKEKMLKAPSKTSKPSKY